MLKIAYLLKMYPRFSETFIVNEILELERRGVDVRIYSLRKPDDGRFHAKLAKVKANVVYVPQYPEYESERILEAHETLRSRVPERYQAALALVKKRGQPYAGKRFLQAGYVAAHLLAHPVHAIHAHFASSAASVANLINQLIDVPYSFTAHAKDIYHESVSVHSLKRKIRAARFVVAVNRFNQAHLRQILGDEAGDIRSLYNGIDLTLFRPDHQQRKEENLILGVGRLVEKKGFADLIRACGLLQDWSVDFQCRIIGKGEMRESLNALIGDFRLDERVKLLGAQPQDEVRRAMRRATVFALPCIVGSDGNRDALPTVILEAMAMGLPAISTRITGIPEIIDHEENGLIVEAGDYTALAHELARLLALPNQRHKMGRAARQKVSQLFDVRKNVGQLQAWLSEPVEMPATPQPTLTSTANLHLEVGNLIDQVKPAALT